MKRKACNSPRDQLSLQKRTLKSCYITMAPN